MFDKNDNISEEIVTEEQHDSHDEIELEEVENTTSAKVTKLKKQLKASEKEKLEHLEALQRAKADFLNTRRRLEEQLRRDTQRAREQFIEDILPLADSFDMALQHSNEDGAGDQGLHDGIRAIHSQLKSLFKTYDVEEIEAEGKSFDPNNHEAISTAAGPEGSKPETVIAVLQKGYRTKERLLRPAKVIISN